MIEGRPQRFNERPISPREAFNVQVTNAIADWATRNLGHAPVRISMGDEVRTFTARDLAREVEERTEIGTYILDGYWALTQLRNIASPRMRSSGVARMREGVSTDQVIEMIKSSGPRPSSK